MKIKNYYAFVAVAWIITTIIDCFACVVNFVDGTYLIGLIFLIITIAFSFVSGILVQKAIEIYKHNQLCDFLEHIEDYLEEEPEEITPFEEFESGNDFERRN